MTWERKRVLVTVKAYPERSRSHGDTVCTAGITDDGEWIRLYPVDFQHFLGDQRIPKYSVIECECKKADHEKLQRKESHRVRDGSIKVVDTSMVDPADWDARREWVMPLLSPSIEQLREDFESDRTSLGLIKPSDVMDFRSMEDIKTDLHARSERQRTFEGRTVPIVTKVPHQFKYVFSCYGCPENSHHEIQCEDWELLESYRKWGESYPDPEVLWAKLHQKFYERMVAKDLHFFMGMYSLQPSWLIIGLFYPPPLPNTRQINLGDVV